MRASLGQSRVNARQSLLMLHTGLDRHCRGVRAHHFVSYPTNATDAIHTVVFALGDGLQPVRGVVQALSILRKVSERRSRSSCKRMAILLHGLGLAGSVGIGIETALRAGPYVEGTPPEDDDAEYAVWVRGDGEEWRRLGLDRTDWGCPDVEDPDCVLGLSCLPAAAAPEVALLVTLAMQNDLLTLFSALLRLMLDRGEDVVDLWHEALRILCWVVRHGDRLEPPVLPTIASMACEEWPEPDEVTPALLDAIKQARSIWGCENSQAWAGEGLELEAES